MVLPKAFERLSQTVRLSYDMNKRPKAESVIESQFKPHSRKARQVRAKVVVFIVHIFHGYNPEWPHS